MPNEAISARNLLSAASAFVNKQNPQPAPSLGENRDGEIPLVDEDGELHPSDESFVGNSPMMTLLLAYLTTDLVQSRYVQPIVEVNLQKIDVARYAQEIRDLLYCMHDCNYFDSCDGRNQTLTNSMLFNDTDLRASSQPEQKTKS